MSAGHGAQHPPVTDLKAAYATARKAQIAGRFDEAARLYKAILAKKDLAEPAFQLGMMAAQAGKRAAAAQWFRRALRTKPQQTEIWGALLQVLDGRDRAQALAEARKRGVRLPEGAADPLADAAALVAKGQLARARKAYRALIAGGAPRVRILAHWADALRRHGHLDAALEVIGPALGQGAPPTLRLLRAQILETQGKLDAAETDLRQVLDAVPDNPDAWTALMRAKRQRPGADDVTRLEALVAKGGLPQAVERGLSFALAKALEDQGRDAEVFAHLDRANALMRAEFPWDFNADHDWLAQMIAAWTPMPGGHDGAAPIFIVGTPRSGTTLVETILAAHADVVPGDELALFTPLATPAIRAFVGQGTAFDVARLGQAYADAAQAKTDAPQAARITDKSISTYSVMGYVQNALPQARFVVLDRDPRDVGLSIYKNRFADGMHRYSTDLSDIAKQIRLFEAAITAWEARLPDAIHRIGYEALTHDPEPTIRALLAFCGLDWDAACLMPEKTARNVKTLSSVQVRQPINTRSVGAWRRFETDLQPLVDTLAETRFSFG